MTSAPTALALQVPSQLLGSGTPMPGSGPPAIVKPITQPMMGPPPMSANQGYAMPMRPSYPPVGGSTNEPVVTPPPAPSRGGSIALVVIGLGALLVVVGGAITTWVVLSHRGPSLAGSAGASTTAPLVTLTTPTATVDVDAALAPLHGTARPPATNIGGGGASTAIGTLTPTATATAPTTATVKSAKACREQCIKECDGDENQDSCEKQCFLECPPL